MLFKVLAGRHTQDNVVYSKGDVVETKLNLIEMFGDNRFKREFELEMEDKKTPIQTPDKVKAGANPTRDESVEDEPDDEDDEDVKDEPEPLGDDLTARFSAARSNKLLVFKKGNKFYVTTEDEPGKALNKKALKRSEVVKFIEGKVKKD